MYLRHLGLNQYTGNPSREMPPQTPASIPNECEKLIVPIVGVKAYDSPNETMFFVPTTMTRAGPGCFGLASAAKVEEMIKELINAAMKKV